jgi:hypothetical protein
MPDSQRELLLAQMETVFANLTPADSGGGTVFGGVFDAPKDGREHKGQNTISILEGDEIYIEVVSPDKRDRRLAVELQAIGWCPRGTKPRAYANSLLADLEEIVEANSKWGGLAYATLFQSNVVERINTADRSVEVVLFIAIQYRTKRSDPRT